MLVEKEIISPATHWYRDEATGLPRKLVVTPELTKHWHDQGNKMLGLGLTVPVPCEHDFSAHPMTPADKLKSNAGWVKEYRLRDNVLFGVVDVQDEELAKKLPNTIRWTSPWISSFTDGQGRDWKNVISHLALTTRPRIIKQAPFSGIAAALSIATDIALDATGKAGFCLSRAGRLVQRKKDKKLRPQYPIAFSLFSGGIKLAEDEDMKELDKDGEDVPETPEVDAGGGDGAAVPSPDAAQQGMEQFSDPNGDVKMEELLADLLGALDIHVEKSGNEDAFKRALYNAAMTKIHELTGKAREQEQGGGMSDPNNPPPNDQAAGGGANPLIQQEQQPMYMSLEDINKIGDPTMKGIALSMYNENVKLRAEMDTDRKKINSLNDAKLKEENAKRSTRVHLLSKLSPRVKADLDAMLALPAMALSMGDGGVVIDPMAQTLAVLEKGLTDVPRLLTVDHASLSMQAQPRDEDILSDEEADKIADGFARKMGCAPLEKKAG